MSIQPLNEPRFNQDERPVSGKSLTVIVTITDPSRPPGHRALSEIQVTAYTSGPNLHIPGFTIPQEPSR
jgi:hypothetical protein